MSWFPAIPTWPLQSPLPPNGSRLVMSPSGFVRLPKIVQCSKKRGRYLITSSAYNLPTAEKRWNVSAPVGFLSQFVT